jgi:hypothetical protein
MSRDVVNMKMAHYCVVLSILTTILTSVRKYARSRRSKGEKRKKSKEKETDSASACLSI